MGRAENTVEGYLRTQARKHGALCYKFTSPGFRGVPDDIIIYNGKVIFIETKSDIGKTSNIQEIRIQEMKDHGADVRVCKTRKSIDKVLSDLIPKYRSGLTSTKTTSKSTRQKPVSIKHSLIKKE